MKKTWKERLYNVSCSKFAGKYIPTLPMGLALLSIVCCFGFGILFDWMLLSTILLYMFWILPVVGWFLLGLFEAVRSYNKETFCCNNIMTSLLANESFVGFVLYWPLGIVLILVANIVFVEDSYGFRVTSFGGCFLLAVFSIVISKPISKRFKKKIVYIENENSNVKDN